jgi:HSP20 family protein
MALKDLITWNHRKPVQVQDGSRYPIANLQREMGRLFDDFLREFDGFSNFPFRRESVAEFSPKVDVNESDKTIEITAEVPGMDEKDVKVTLKDDIITIEGEKKQEKEEKEKDYYHLERSYGSFQRSLRIPCEIESDKVDASFKKGVLRITLPKSPKAQENVRKIEVKSE